MRALVLLAATVGATALTGVPAAQAASWTSQSGAAYQTCTAGRTHNRVTYTTCVQHNAGFAKVRVVVKVATTARRGVKASPHLRVPGRSNNINAPGCSTAWLNANRIVQNGNAAIWIPGGRRPGMVVRGMNLDAKKQENSVKHCGPATVQAALWTMKGSAPARGTSHTITVPQLIRASTTSQYIDDNLVFAARK
ncbi:hypothetical protein GCM10009678_20810 [Actinomadura kijaniata]|uniref:Uncharacterized protein n=1 Tax=Actinomadura namibiensis TaxID=182080 RepID=A0A7W3QJL2_ACTNM|nr:hypothetical protein [Actinomadura namibiensis]MBA8949063.1 hypothetical protein [Actinomadura namibiensis]